MKKYLIKQSKTPQTTNVIRLNTSGLSNLEDYLARRLKINIRYTVLKPDLSLWYFDEKIMQLEDISHEL